MFVNTAVHMTSIFVEGNNALLMFIFGLSKTPSPRCQIH